MIRATPGTTRRASRLPRFLHLDWLWSVLGITSQIVIALLSITSLLMLRPDLVDMFGLTTMPVTWNAVLWLNIHPAFIAALPASMLILSAVKEMVMIGDAPLDPVQIRIFRRAAIYGWIVEFRGDGRYELYGPDGQRESCGDLTDLDWFVTDLEDQHDHDAPAEPVDDRQPGLGGESGAVSALDRG